MYSNPASGAIITLFGNGFPFATGKAEKAHTKGNIRSSLDNMGVIMDKGWFVMIYPEGELTVGGPMQPFLWGTGLKAIGGNLLAIPMDTIIHKFGMPASFPSFQCGRLEVSFGAPLLPPWDGSVEGTTEKIEESVRNLAIV
jgi:long-chain acyl-CoA synthetase